MEVYYLNKPSELIYNFEKKNMTERRIAKIMGCPNRLMTGRELRRLRVAAGLSERELAERYGTYRRQITRWETSARFELHPDAMALLLKTLGATSV